MWGQLPHLELREEQAWTHPTPRLKLRPHWRACGYSLLDDGFAVVSGWTCPIRSHLLGVPVEFSGYHGLGQVCRKLLLGPQESSHWGPSRTREMSDTGSHSCSSSHSHGGKSHRKPKEKSLLHCALQCPSQALCWHSLALCQLAKENCL